MQEASKATLSVAEATGLIIAHFKSDLQDYWLSWSDGLGLTCEDYVSFDERNRNKEGKVLLDLFDIWQDKCAKLNINNRQMKKYLDKVVDQIGDKPLLTNYSKRRNLGDRIQVLKASELQMNWIRLHWELGLQWFPECCKSNADLSVGILVKYEMILREWLEDRKLDISSKIELIKNALIEISLDFLIEELPDPSAILEDPICYDGLLNETNITPERREILKIHTDGRKIRRSDISVTALSCACLPQFSNQASPCSNVLRIEPLGKTGKRINDVLKFEIPIQARRQVKANQYEEIVYQSVKGKWVLREAVREESASEDGPSMHVVFPGLSEATTLVVVRRLVVDEKDVGVTGGALDSTVNKDVGLTFPAHTFAGTSSKVQLQVEATDSCYPEEKSEHQCSPFLYINSDNPPNKPIEVRVPCTGKTGSGDDIYHVLRQDSALNWQTLRDKAQRHSDTGAVKLKLEPNGKTSNSIVVIKTRQNATKSEIEAEAKELDNRMHSTKVVIIFKQHEMNLKNALIGLCRFEQLEEAVEHMIEKRFSKGPPAQNTNPFYIRERQRIRMFFMEEMNNIHFKPEPELEMSFSMDTALLQTRNAKLALKPDLPEHEDKDGMFKVEVNREESEEPDDDMEIIVDLEEHNPAQSRTPVLNLADPEHKAIIENVMVIKEILSVKNARKMIARHLGLHDMVDEFEERYKVWSEIVFQVFSNWIERAKEEATVAKMIECLKQEKCMDAVDRIDY